MIECLGAAALGGMVLLSVQGCAPASSAATDTGGEHSLAISDARAAYDSYLAASNAAAAQGNQAQGLALAADAQWAVLHAQYTALASGGTPVPQYKYGTPVFYVPALAGYPQWFMVATTRTQIAGTGTGSAGTAAGAATRTIMVFERSAAGQPWTLNGAATLHRALPTIATDRDGYAISVSHSDTGLLLPPDVVGPSQAGVVDEGPANPSAAVVGSGPLTTGLYAAQAAQSSSDSAHGWYYQWLLAGSPFDQFGLQTTDGGALVLYGMYLNTTTEHPGLVSGSPIPVPANFTPLLAAPTEVGYHAVYANWTFQYAAIDPPASAKTAKVQVIAAGGGPSYGHAY
ncbi:MAG: hypothetical protein ACRDOL_15400 [Streptosporangiaceae bacterium]